MISRGNKEGKAWKQVDHRCWSSGEGIWNSIKWCQLIELDLALLGKVWLTEAEPKTACFIYYYYPTKAPSPSLWAAVRHTACVCVCPFTEPPWGVGFFFLNYLFKFLFYISLPTSILMNYGLCRPLLSAVTPRRSGRHASHSERTRQQHYLIWEVPIQRWLFMTWAPPIWGLEQP